MNVKEAYETFRQIYEKIGAYQHALKLLYTDGVTAAPPGSAEGRGKTSGNPNITPIILRRNIS